MTITQDLYISYYICGDGLVIVLDRGHAILRPATSTKLVPLVQYSTLSSRCRTHIFKGSSLTLALGSRRFFAASILERSLSKAMILPLDTPAVCVADKAPEVLRTMLPAYYHCLIPLCHSSHVCSWFHHRLQSNLVLTSLLLCNVEQHWCLWFLPLLYRSLPEPSIQSAFCPLLRHLNGIYICSVKSSIQT
jgi:hypothetical protein